jgi:signal peptidase
MQRKVELVLEALAILCIVALLAGQLLGQPVLLSYVTTGSMEPALEPGEGFVAVPAGVAGEVEEGDVITFRAERLNGGGLTTHRVVDVTERGYVTKGDANPFTDQDGGEPPVKQSQVAAVAWQPGGTVLAIPGVGTAVTGVQGLLESVQRTLAGALGMRSLLGVQGVAYVLFALSVIVYAADLWLSRGTKRRRDRDRTRDSGTSTRLVVAACAAVIVAGATASMVIPAGTDKFGVVSAETDAPGPGVIEQGTNESVTYRVANGGVLPVVVFLDSGTDGVDAEPRELSVPARSSVNATLTLSAPPDTGYYRQFLVQHRYLAVLPQPVIATLYEVHPWLPLLVIDGLLGGGVYLVGMGLVGTGRLRSRSRDGRRRTPDRP